MRPGSRAVVLGAGISGLVAALELQAAGAQVTVLDAAGRTGGVLHAGTVGGARVDLGCEAMLARRPEGVDLARRLGLGDRLVAPTAARPGLWRRDGVRPLPAGTVMGVPGEGSDLSAVLHADELETTRRAVREAAARPRRAREDDVSVAEAVVADVGRPVLDLLVEPLLGGVYAGRTDRLSLAATVPQLMGARRRGEPLAQAVARLAALASPATAGAPVFTGLRGGMAGLADAAAQRLREGGAEVRLGVLATGLERDGTGWRVRTDVGDVTADVVVTALPTTTTARLLVDAAPDAARVLAGIPVAGVAVVAFAVAGLRPAASGLLVPPVESARAGLAVKAVTFSSTKWGWVGEQSPDAAVVRASLGRVGEQAALQRDDDALVALARRDLAQLLGPEHEAALRDAPARPVRWGGALPQYEPGHLERVRRVRRSVRDARGLVVTGGFLDGVGVPACVAAARSGVAEVLTADWGA